MAIIGGEETATETIDMLHVEKVKPSKFGEFCRRNGINPNLIMLKITLFVMYGGKYNYDCYSFFNCKYLRLDMFLITMQI